MNKTILIGVGAVAAFLLYRKFMATPKAEEVTEPEEQAEEQGEEGGAPSGGGGGGSAPAPKSMEKPTTKKTLQVATKGRPPQRINKRGNLRPIGGKPMRPPQGMSRPMARPIARPLPASKPIVKFAGFMDFDGFPDVQANIM